MQTTQIGDRVQAHYTKKFSDGSVRKSRARGDAPLELTVGTDHRRLPGLGLALVGLAEGQSVTVQVPPDMAFGLPDPTRVYRLNRTRFPADEKLSVGRVVRVRLSQGRTRRVRVLEVRGQAVVVDTNHPRCGQSLVLEVEVIAILASGVSGGCLSEPEA